MICVVCGKRFEAEEDVCPTCREIVKNKRTLRWFRNMRNNGGGDKNEIKRNNRHTGSDACAGCSDCQCNRPGPRAK